MVLVPVLVLCAPGANRRRRLAQLGMVVGTAALVVAPWLIRNVEVFHPPVLLSSNLDSVLAGANCGPVYDGPMLGLWDFNCTDNTHPAVLDEARHARQIGDRALRYAADHAARVPLVMGVRILRGWGLYDPAQQVRVEAVESRSVGWGQFAWFGSMVTLALALPGMVSLRRRRFELAVVARPGLGYRSAGPHLGRPALRTHCRAGPCSRRRTQRAVAVPRLPFGRRRWHQRSTFPSL